MAHTDSASRKGCSVLGCRLSQEKSSYCLPHYFEYCVRGTAKPPAAPSHSPSPSPAPRPPSQSSADKAPSASPAPLVSPRAHADPALPTSPVAMAIKKLSISSSSHPPAPSRSPPHIPPLRSKQQRAQTTAGAPPSTLSSAVAGVNRAMVWHDSARSALSLSPPPPPPSASTLLSRVHRPADTPTAPSPSPSAPHPPPGPAPVSSPPSADNEIKMVSHPVVSLSVVSSAASGPSSNFCPECGAKRIVKSSFCSNCGFCLKSAPERAAPVAPKNLTIAIPAPQRDPPAPPAPSRAAPSAPPPLMRAGSESKIAAAAMSAIPFRSPRFKPTRCHYCNASISGAAKVVDGEPFCRSCYNELSSTVSKALDNVQHHPAVKSPPPPAPASAPGQKFEITVPFGNMANAQQPKDLSDAELKKFFLSLYK